MVPRSAKTHEPDMVVWDTVVELSAYTGATCLPVVTIVQPDS